MYWAKEQLQVEPCQEPKDYDSVSEGDIWPSVGRLADCDYNSMSAVPVVQEVLLNPRILLMLKHSSSSF